jgi:ABC-2 type transport system ATP-binding protein
VLAHALGQLPAPSQDGRSLSIPLNYDTLGAVAAAAQALRAANVWVEDLAIRRPSLDDVFLTLTGSAGGQAAQGGPGAPGAPGAQAGQAAQAATPAGTPAGTAGTAGTVTVA